MKDIKRVRLKIFGLVQGVNFRYYTKKQAEKLNLTGYAKNNPDGTVEVEAEGEEDKINQLIQLVKSGPPLARVEGIEIQERAIKKEEGFYIL